MNPSMELSNNKFYLTADNFSKHAKYLRSEFDKKFKDPLKTDNERFVWDYWHVPDQYTVVRTPAYYYFSAQLYKKIHEELLNFGRTVLGCFDITPPWLSYYIEGCKQELHADVPHGPWAFVYSLTEWDIRRFTGGETFILNPETLNFWQSFENFKGIESKDLTTRIEPNFNRLTLFDPRLPHGVREVRGTHDPRKARLVIHGWFKDPEPYVVGPMTRKQAAQGCNNILEKMSPLFNEFADCHGTLSVRFKVNSSGHILNPKYMTNTLQSLVSNEARVYELNRTLFDILESCKFPKSKGSSEVTLPILFHF